MPAMLFGRGAFRRDYGNLPALRLVNMYAETAATAEAEVVLQSRKGLEEAETWGAGPNNGIFTAKGVFGGDRFTISGNTLYREGVSVGTVAGSGPTSWAASDLEIVVTRGDHVYSYNGTDLVAIDFPDNADVVAVAYIAGLFIFVREGGHQWYWSSVLDARTIDALDFASAELRPDNLLDVKVLAGTLYLFGEESTEAWYPTGGLDLPFTRIDQRLFGKGIIATGAVAEVNESLVFAGHDGAVYRIAGGLEPVSHHGIEERVRQSATHSAFAFSYEGHHFFCLRLATATFCFDVVTGEWCEFATYGRTNWRAKNAISTDREAYFGDDEDGTIWKFGDVFKDGDGDLEGYFTALKPIRDGTEPFDSVTVSANVGQTEPLDGDDANPTIEMRASRDGGNSFGDWRESTLGAQGKYRNRATWRRNGIFDAPGAYLEFRVTDQSPRRISGVYYNEARGGRSR